MTGKKEDAQRAALARWDQDGGAPRARRLQRALGQEAIQDTSGLAALDDAHQSSRRGEHRYPAAHQTDTEQKARRDRDILKQKLRGSG